LGFQEILKPEHLEACGSMEHGLEKMESFFAWVKHSEAEQAGHPRPNMDFDGGEPQFWTSLTPKTIQVYNWCFKLYLPRKAVQFTQSQTHVVQLIQLYFSKSSQPTSTHLSQTCDSVNR
jgi:hypothetical protein